MLFMVFISTATATDSNIYVECAGVHFTRLTPYETNVNSLFSSLVDSASVTNFNKFEISQTDVVYGLCQCRGDLESSKCKDCVASSVNQLKTTCPLSVGGSIQLDGCFLKYDKTPFFGVVNTTEVLKRCGPSIEYNSDILSSRDDALVNLIAGNGKYFHGGDYGTIRGVAQCVQDLSLSDCQDCLSEASGKLRSQCETSSWGDMFLGKCYIRYHDRDNGHFSNNNRKNDGGGKISKLIKVIIGCVAGILLCMGAGVTIYIKFNCCNTTNLFVKTEGASVKDRAAREPEPASVKAKPAREKAKPTREKPEAASENHEAARKKTEAASVKDKAAREPEARSVKARAAREEPASVKAKPAREKPEAASVKAKPASEKHEAASVKPAASKRSKTARTYSGK